MHQILHPNWYLDSTHDTDVDTFAQQIIQERFLINGSVRLPQMETAFVPKSPNKELGVSTKLITDIVQHKCN